MKVSKILKISLASFILFIGFVGYSQENKMVGGAEMYPTKNIIDNLTNSLDHTIFVKTLGILELSTTLKEDGPFTVFAPANSAFKKLPESSLQAFLKPENREELKEVLSYHVVSGNYSLQKLMAMAKDSGFIKMKTLSGASLIATIEDGNLILKDAAGNMSKITVVDVSQSNGVIHVIDTILIPTM